MHKHTIAVTCCTSVLQTYIASTLPVLCQSCFSLCTGLTPAWLILIGVLMGLCGGMLLRTAQPGPHAIEVLALPGDIMLRLLKMLVLPLVAGSMIAGKPPMQSGSLLV